MMRLQNRGEDRRDASQSPRGDGVEYDASEQDFTISEIERFAARLTELADINSFKPAHG